MGCWSGTEEGVSVRALGGSRWSEVACEGRERFWPMEYVRVSSGGADQKESK